MINAGLPLFPALEILRDQNKGKMKTVLTEIVHSVESGKSLSDSIAMQKGFLSNVEISLVRAGEQSGKLEVVLNRLANGMEQIQNNKSKVKLAFVYPGVVFSIAVIVVVVLLVKLVPELESLYQGFNAQLPDNYCFLFCAEPAQFYSLKVGKF